VRQYGKYGRIEGFACNSLPLEPHPEVWSEVAM
jgi:hypothetical protein